MERVRKLTRRARAYFLGALALMMLPLIGTIGIPGRELFPTPDAAGLVLLRSFIAYMASAFGWLLLQKALRPA